MGDNAASDTLPDNAIPFTVYRGNIILDATLNDSVQIKALFDTGAWGLAIPKKYKTSTEPESDEWPPRDRERLRIGNKTRSMITTYTSERSQFLQWFKGECVLLGWDFFEDEIVAISYDKKYIQLIDRTALGDMQGYSCVSFAERGRRLLIPASVCVQEKRIEGNFWIDTGLNASLFFTYNIPQEYNLELDNVLAGQAKGLEQKVSKISVLQADTIAIGKNYISHRDVLFTDQDWSVFGKNDMYIGLIGNQFFHDFSVIFDFGENKLYLKPL